MVSQDLKITPLSLALKVLSDRAMVAHACVPKTQETKAGGLP